jgi:hypothetical protein
VSGGPRGTLLTAAAMLAGSLLSGCAGASAVVELDRAATEADRLPGDQLAGFVFPNTARFVGTVDDVDVFVALGPVGNRDWGPSRNDRGVEFCLIALESGGMGTSCGRLPLGLQTSGLELQLIGTAADVPEGFQRLSDSVVVLD